MDGTQARPVSRGNPDIGIAADLLKAAARVRAWAEHRGSPDEHSRAQAWYGFAKYEYQRAYNVRVDSVTVEDWELPTDKWARRRLARFERDVQRQRLRASEENLSCMEWMRDHPFNQYREQYAANRREVMHARVRASKPTALAPARRSAPGVRARPRGAGRPAARRPRAGPADDDSGEPEPPGEPAGRRLCQACGQDISSRRKGAKTCGPKCRQRFKRHPGPLDRGLEADAYLELPAWQHDWLRQRANDSCRCNGSHLLDASEGLCVKCGHERRDGAAPYYVQLWERHDHTRATVAARSVERDHPRPLEETAV